ncbi:alpha/beta fold hydrolase [Cyanobium sp. WAJ14-Wanaka]|uniref:alpha/beta fold hydrolase n=1 Tax=Cyanobium sp. WAJ14-Wanaka TaxID=2823725 RepID=UPI0020CEF5B7|nr:alpha/beta fold hydrolase [Cyanobium sp. WAJ14-Wanaka]
MASWNWRGHNINFLRAGRSDQPNKVLLIHGFGASIGHWRQNIPALSEQADLIALDLLGFGASDKPRSHLANEPATAGSVRYCFDLWAEQVVDAAQYFLADRGQLHLIGNSIGAVVALAAAKRMEALGTAPTQVVLIDCAQRTLDDKRAAQLSGFEQTTRPLTKQLVRQRWLISPLFQLLAQPGFIRQVLNKAYPSGANIDADLIELLHKPSTTPGASESFRGFVNLFNDYLAPEILAEFKTPVRMLWGEKDPWEDVVEAQRWAEDFACIKELRVLPGLGHCPHDEAPEIVNPILKEWISAPGPPKN